MHVVVLEAIPRCTAWDRPRQRSNSGKIHLRWHGNWSFGTESFCKQSWLMLLPSQRQTLYDWHIHNHGWSCSHHVSAILFRKDVGVVQVLRPIVRKLATWQTVEQRSHKGQCCLTGHLTTKQRHHLPYSHRFVLITLSFFQEKPPLFLRQVVCHSCVILVDRLVASAHMASFTVHPSFDCSSN